MQTKIIAHRGIHHQFTENTLEAFELALKQGADGLELDVHYSKDGVLMVYHDFDLNRLTAVKGLISEYTCETLQSILLWGHSRIPRLIDVLDLIKDYQKHRESPILLNVELKAGSRIYPQIEEKVVTLCESILLREQLIYSSFDHHALVKIKAIAPNLNTGVLTASSMYEPWHYLSHLKADYFHPNAMTLDATELDVLREHQVKTNTYTVNDLSQAEQLLKADVHAIITDESEKMLTLRTKLQLGESTQDLYQSVDESPLTGEGL